MLLAVYAILTWSSISRKVATVDETTNALAAWTSLRFGDFRLDPEDPPLWHEYAAIPNGPAALSADFHSGEWRVIPQTMSARGPWQINTLYRTPGNDPDAFIARSRFMMLLVAVVTGAMIAAWAWQAAGALAAVAATTLFVLDPNFIAHGGLVKNDVIVAGVMLALLHAVWRLGQRVTPPRLVVAALLCGIVVLVKFSGLLMGPLVALLLLARALMPAPWRVLGREMTGRLGRSLVAAGLCVMFALVAYGMLWAGYRFRFAPTPDPQVRFNIDEVLTLAARNRLLAETGHAPAEAQVAEARRHPPRSVSFAVWANDHRLLPHAWLYGFLSQYAQSQVRPGFALGHYTMTGFWWYYPFVMLVKTPLATLAALALAGIVAVARLARRADGATPVHRPRLWLAMVLGVPVIFYMSAAMMSVHNAGVRHLLPVYGLLYVMCGIAAARAAGAWRKPTALLGALLAVALAVETLFAYPNYIPFFNVAAGGSRGGLRLLSDSNIDWGQDLLLVAEWQRRHPGTLLYLNYFGHADPVFYGIRSINLPGGYWYGPEPQPPGRPGVVAISAMNLQGTYYDARLRDYYAPLRRAKPLEVLGGSIYLFPFPLPAQPEALRDPPGSGRDGG